MTKIFFASFVLFSCTIIACTGSDGSDGQAGLACWDANGDGVQDSSEDLNSDGMWDARDCQPQQPAPAAAETCALCHGPERDFDLAVKHGLIPSPSISEDNTPIEVSINGVSVDAGTGAVTVNFDMVTEEGDSYAGLGASDVRFTLAQLNPAAGGNASFWQSYINSGEDPTGKPGTGDGSVEDRATYQRGSGGTLVDFGNGNYDFTFGNGDNTADMDIRDVLGSSVSTVAVTYDETLTHRIAMQFGGGLAIDNNPNFDFVPDGVTALATREIVSTATCNSCHQDLGLHGGGRKEVEYCVTCHNPGSIDANSDQTVDFKVMIHKIHMGRDLPSVVAGGEYAIWGYRDRKHDYSEVGFPQAPTNCTKCHDESLGLADADNWKNVPTAETCGSCHDDVDFAAGTNHNVQADNSQCASCHPATGEARAIVDAHEDRALLLSAAFEYNIDDIVYDSSSGDLDITFSITDPTSGDAAYDLFADPEFTAPNGVTRLAIVVGWDTADYTNVGAGTRGQPISINPLDSTAPATDNSDGTYTVSTTLPAEAFGTGVVAIEGHPAGDDGTGNFSVRVPVTNAFQYFAITAGTPVARRVAVDIAKCDNCHGKLSVHGANRNDQTQVCVICHNPNATDIRQRPDDHTDTSTPTADGKKEESIDFKHMIHAIHGAAKRKDPYVGWGFGGNEHVFGPEEVTFPGILNRCTACHVDNDSVALPLESSILGSTIDSDPSAAIKADTTDEALGDPGDDLNISPTAAVCSACHQSTLAQEHMELNGAAFGVLEADISRLE